MREEEGIGNEDRLEKRGKRIKLGRKKSRRRSRYKKRPGGEKKCKKGRVMGIEEIDNKKQKQMLFYHHLSGKGFSNSWAPPLMNDQALN